MNKLKTIYNRLKNTRWFSIATNKFVLVTIGFLVWMVFLDVNSWVIHNQLNNEIDKLQQSIDFYKTEITKDKRQLNELTSDPEKLEKYAREQYWMKKPGEEIYLIKEVEEK